MPGSALVYAHRGLHVQHRENTLAAFEAAHEAGADGIEFDVRAARDGTLVVHHDPRMKRLGALRELTGAEIPSSVPRLGEVLEWLRKRPGLLADVEVKESGLEGRVAEALQRGSVAERCVVTSFLPDVVYRFAEIVPRIRRGWILQERIEDPAELAKAARADVLALRAGLVDESTLRAARAVGLEVWAWDVRSGRAAGRLARLGCAALITDHVGAVRSALKAPDAPRQRDPRTGHPGSSGPRAGATGRRSGPR